MDDLDNLSNISGHSSRTNLSNLSGLTGYENEVNSIKNLLLRNGIEQSLSNGNVIRNIKQVNLTKSADVFSLEDRVKNLTNELQNCLKLNEKYKNRLFDLEHKNELAKHDKFEKLLKDNTSLRLQLDNANHYIEKLLIKKNTDKVQNGVVNLEKSNYEKLQYLQSNYNNCIDDNNKLKIDCNSLLLEQKELRLDLETKASCVHELKKKVTEQHVQYQHLLQEDIVIKNELHLVKNNLEHSLKSEKWYKEQLHDCQADKQRIYNEWSELKSSIVNKDYQVQHLTQEVEKLRLKCQNIEYDAMKEKEELTHKINLIKSNSVNNTNCNVNVLESSSINENEINDLKKDIEIIQSNMSEAYVLLNESNKKKADVVAENMILHKTLIQKLLALEASESKCYELQKKIDNHSDRMKINEDELSYLKCEKSKLEIAINISKDEKLVVDESIVKVKETFNKFLQVHKTLKDELSNKTKDLLILQTEKQQLFMNNNWHICEMENVKKTLSEINRKNQSLIEENSKLICDHYNLKSINNNLRRELKESNEKRATIEEINLKFVTENNKVKGMKEEVEDFVKYDEAVVKALLDYFLDCIRYVQKFNNRDEPVSLSHLLNEQNIILHHSHETITKFDDGIKILAQYLRDTSIEIKTTYNENKMLQKKISNMKKHLIPKTESLQKRVDELEIKVQNVSDLLENETSINSKYRDVNKEVVINQTIIDEIKNLRALVKVKELEKKEKEKRYDINVRTLLKKVKEHMRGRNVAEKENRVLKELYETVLDESNDIKLDNHNKTFVVEELGRKVILLEDVNVKLRQNVMDAEAKSIEESKRNRCQGCKELDAIVTELNDTRKEKGIVEEELRRYGADLNEKKAALSDLENQLQDRCFKLLKQEEEINKYKTSIINYKRQLMENDRLIDELSISNDTLKVNSNKLQNDLHNLSSVINKYKFDIDEMNRKNLGLNDMNGVFSKEIELSKMIVLEKNNEIDRLKSQRDVIGKELKRNDEESHGLINKLKNDMNELKEELRSSIDGTLFLKRLNNDMKYAVTTLSNQNKALMQRLRHSANEELPTVPSDLLNIPSPNKLDETLINNLLKNNNNNNCERSKPLIELQNCLKSLKKEMSHLQEEIVQKSFVSYNTT